MGKLSQELNRARLGQQARLWVTGPDAGLAVAKSRSGSGSV